MRHMLTMIGGAELLVVAMIALVGFLVAGVFIAAVILLSRQWTSAKTLEQRLQALEEDVRQLKQKQKP